MTFASTCATRATNVCWRLESRLELGGKPSRRQQVRSTCTRRHADATAVASTQRLFGRSAPGQYSNSTVAAAAAAATVTATVTFTATESVSADFVVAAAAAAVIATIAECYFLAESGNGRDMPESFVEPPIALVVLEQATLDSGRIRRVLLRSWLLVSGIQRWQCRSTRGIKNQNAK
jgi:hypothetical protein